MLRTNLATRPFYNDRAVRVGIAVAVLLVAALTAYNLREVAALNARNAEMTQRAEDAERQSAEFRREAQAIRQSMNSAEMTAVQQAAQEANLLIERRVFSWTELFNEFERTLPPEVRITAVQPQVDGTGRLLVAIHVLSREPEELGQFMDQLEASGRFREVIVRQDQPEDGGLTRSVLQGYYDSQGQPPAAAAPSTSEPSDAAANDSPPAPGNATPPQRGGER
jgi:Tfp pilus assembly protein PilN